MKKKSHEAEPAPSEPEKRPQAADAEIGQLSAEVARLTEENRGLSQRLLEAAADLDNQAKRFARERQVVRDEITARVAREVIEVLDNLDRVIAAAPERERATPIVQGVLAIQALFVDKLRALGIERVDALDRPFDPFQHEAIATEERGDVAPGTVVAEIVRGWRTPTQLVRAAKVRVAKAPAAAQGDEAAEEEEQDGAMSDGAPGAPS